MPIKEKEKIIKNKRKIESEKNPSKQEGFFSLSAEIIRQFFK